MSDYSITDLRINGQRFYAVEKHSKISFYTTNIAAARYWIRAEENDPTLVKPFQDMDASKKEAIATKTTQVASLDTNTADVNSPDVASSESSQDLSSDSVTNQSTLETPAKPVRIS